MPLFIDVHHTLGTGAPREAFEAAHQRDVAV